MYLGWLWFFRFIMFPGFIWFQFILYIFRVIACFFLSGLLVFFRVSTFINTASQFSQLFSLFTVTLSAPPSGSTTYFTGFLIQVRDADRPDSGPVGSFTLLDRDVSQLLSCNHMKVSKIPSLYLSFRYESQTTYSAPWCRHLVKLQILNVNMLLVCFKGSAVSHTSKAHKKEVQVLWNVPHNPPARVQFL